MTYQSGRRPMPVTPALMLALGWESDPVPNGIRFNECKGPDPWVVKFWTVETHIDDEHFQPGDITFGKIIPHGMKKVEYFHELQQLYKESTGKELNLFV